MNPIIAGLLIISGAVALDKAKEVLSNKNPAAWDKLSFRMGVLNDKIEPYKNVNVFQPHTIIAPMLEQKLKRTKNGDEVDKTGTLIWNDYKGQMIIANPNRIEWKMGRKIFEDYIVKRNFHKVRLPAKNDNLYLFIGHGDYEGVLWLTTRYRSTSEGIDGWYYYLEAIYYRAENGANQNDDGDMPLEMARRVYYPPNGGTWHIIPQILDMEDGTRQLTWSAELVKNREIFIEGSDLIKHKARWTNISNHDRPYNVMLYGPPGCGKTTLVKSWIYEEKRCIIQLTAKSLVENIEVAYHLSRCGPHAFLIEDIDRITNEEAQLLLPFFEHERTQIDEFNTTGYGWKPMIFTSCNHPKNVADAIWRPGRVDQIVEVGVPPQSEWNQLITRICEREGVDADSLINNKAHYYIANLCLEELSVAHLEQYIMRVKDEGLEYAIPVGDRTFNPPVKWNGE